MLKVYLSGKISGLNKSDALNWREDAKKALQDVCELICPLRHADMVAQEHYPGLANGLHPEEILQRDLLDIEDSDLILCLFDASSIGTMMELGYAYARDKEIIMILDDEHLAKHPFISGYSLNTVVNSLSEAYSLIAFLEANYNGR